VTNQEPGITEILCCSVWLDDTNFPQQLLNANLLDQVNVGRRNDMSFNTIVSASDEEKDESYEDGNQD
jgi:hypothetical protein